MDLAGTLSNRETGALLRRLAIRADDVTTDNSLLRPVHTDKRRRMGLVPTAITAFLSERGEPADCAEIHAAVEAALGGCVSRSSTRNALRRMVNDSRRLVARVGRGTYVALPPVAD